MKRRTPASATICRHNDPKRITSTSEGERVCICGVILEEKMAAEPPAGSGVQVPLYHQVEKGGDPRDMKVVNKKIHIYASSASEFSNICGKLGLSSFVQRRAWAIYHTMRSRTYFTRAKCAAFAVYIACREGGQAVDERRIKEAVRSVLCVKNAPSMLGAIAEMHDEALKAGIDTNKGHSSGYYLNLAISGKQHLFADPTDYDRFKIRVMANFGRLEGNFQNNARRAVNIALCEMGVRQ